MPNVIKACIKKAQKALGKKKKKEKEKEKEPEKHWLKLNLKDDAGKPMAGIKVRITLPDNTIEEATSDNAGLIHVTDIKPGSCTLDLDWDGTSAATTAFLQ